MWSAQATGFPLRLRRPAVRVSRSRTCCRKAGWCSRDRPSPSAARRASGRQPHGAGWLMRLPRRGSKGDGAPLSVGHDHGLGAPADGNAAGSPAGPDRRRTRRLVLRAHAEAVEKDHPGPEAACRCQGQQAFPDTWPCPPSASRRMILVLRERRPEGRRGRMKVRAASHRDRQSRSSGPPGRGPRRRLSRGRARRAGRATSRRRHAARKWRRPCATDGATAPRHAVGLVRSPAPNRPPRGAQQHDPALPRNVDHGTQPGR